MLDPKITIALNQRDTLVIVRNDNTSVLKHISFKLPDAHDLGFAGFCMGVGETVVRMLASSHEQTFSKYPNLVPPAPLVVEDRDLIVKLMHRSHKERTSLYVPAIDRLVEKNEDNLSLTSLPEVRASIRQSVLIYR